MPQFYRKPSSLIVLLFSLILAVSICWGWNTTEDDLDATDSPTTACGTDSGQWQTAIAATQTLPGTNSGPAQKASPESSSASEIPQTSSHSSLQKAPPKQNYQPLRPNPFAKIDRYALKTPDSEAETVESLAAYLEKAAKTDLEKARAIYVWLAEHIRYDDDTYNAPNMAEIAPDYTPEYVLANRLAICDGFSRLFQALGEAMNLKIRRVIGTSKGYGYGQRGQLSKQPDHAWNIIYIDGKYGIYDATWGAGYGVTVDGKLKGIKKFTDDWFNVDPYAAIFTHLPENANYARVKPALNRAKFERLPQLWPRLFTMGFDARNIYRKLWKNQKLEVVESYSVDTEISLNLAPTGKFLTAGKPLLLAFYIPRGNEVAIIDANNNWTFFTREKGTFELTYTPEAQGPLQISVKHEGAEEFHTFLKYEVKGSKRPV